MEIIALIMGIEVPMAELRKKNMLPSRVIDHHLNTDFRLEASSSYQPFNRKPYVKFIIRFLYILERLEKFKFKDSLSFSYNLSL